MKTLDQADLKDKKVLLRVDFNVPMNGKKVSDNQKLRETLPTINLLLKKGAAIIIAFHFGRPEGKRNPDFSVKPVALELENLLKRTVLFVDDVVGEKAQKTAKALKSGEVMMIENLRFEPGEEAGDEQFAKKLASLADVFVQDGFANAHRDHASMVAVTRYLPSYAGLLFIKEFENLSKILNDPKRPFVVIAGGKKLETKVDLLKSIVSKADIVLTGGGMANTFLVAEGYEVGKSFFDEEYISEAEDLLRLANEKGVEILLPDDVMVTKNLGDNPKGKNRDVEAVEDGDIIIDIGTQTIAKFAQPIKFAGTIFWNGSLGIAEIESGAKGTKAVAKMIGESDAISVIGGGDTAGFLDKEGLTENFTYVSTAGGAAMEFLTGNKMPGVEALK